MRPRMYVYVKRHTTDRRANGRKTERGEGTKRGREKERERKRVQGNEKGKRKGEMGVRSP